MCHDILIFIQDFLYVGNTHHTCNNHSFYVIRLFANFQPINKVDFEDLGGFNRLLT